MATRLSPFRWFLLPLVLIVFLGVMACGSTSEGEGRVLYIGGIPDQDASVLQARFNIMAEYLSEQAGIPVRYHPSVDYAAVVTAYRQGDLHLVWFGGLTGVQARLVTPGSIAFAQRPEDAEFRSVYITRTDSGIQTLEDLKGRSFTFGSESSTSGHLIPRSFLMEAGIDPERDFTSIGYSGSHDTTWKQVEAGTYDAAAMNIAQWRDRVESGAIDTAVIHDFHTSGPSYNYHWAMRPDIDATFGPGVSQKLQDAILRLDAGNGGKDAEIMGAFLADQFIPTSNENYDGLENVARALGIIQ
jgi:phosphonate transport system substrate-binding protein